ncbi:hypothetical protein [Sphingomonas sp. Leaf25]|uniref:hypothetical protein n=1 Tax=Sphingomonas sp. Leaf25 TaxID=1735692 RepID=UPI0006F526F1|nr:hypothetical protein [Sphingomonas sp. Leaf25]KQN06990.1 hypothetical protein ASE78_14765 [Sphingomonas sp. Leaf25]
MSVVRTLAVAVATAFAVAATPASAQFFLKPYDTSGERVTGAEPGIATQALPGATPEELRAALMWNLRAGLNVAALQCQFEPSLLTLGNYNALLFNHADELKKGYDTLGKYFVRTAGSAKAGQTALDQFGTRVYSGFSTVSAQLGFCQAAGEIGQEAIFVPRGYLGEFAEMRMRKLRNSLVAYGEQQFGRNVNWMRPVRLYEFGNPKCWRKGLWQVKRCGAFPS